MIKFMGRKNRKFNIRAHFRMSLDVFTYFLCCYSTDLDRLQDFWNLYIGSISENNFSGSFVLYEVFIIRKI